MIERFPVIRRARDFHLYDERGTRYLDFYQAGGRALLSHRPPGLGRAIKDALSRGLYAAYPSREAGRLEALLSTLFPSHPEVRLYASYARALAAVGGSVADPALGGLATTKDGSAMGERVPQAVLYRPFITDGRASDARPEREYAFLLPILPFPAAFAPQPVCAVDAEALRGLGDADEISPVALAGSLQAAHLLAGPRPEKATVDPTASFDERELALWRRRGRYVELLCPQERFEEVFALFLEHGILINPVYPGPSILPGWCSAGEFENFVKVSRMADT
jgi:hypothetical protein